MIVENICAEENRAEISFLGKPTYTLTNEIIKNDRIVGRSYLIKINLQNTGTKKSEELVVNITDEEGFSLRNLTYINPGESKIISFTWSTLLIRDQEITANFYPSDLDARWTKYNKGKTTFTIKMDNENDGITATNTPGFEFLILIFAMIFLTIIYKRR